MRNQRRSSFTSRDRSTNAELRDVYDRLTTLLGEYDARRRRLSREEVRAIVVARNAIEKAM